MVNTNDKIYEKVRKGSVTFYTLEGPDKECCHIGHMVDRDKRYFLFLMDSDENQLPLKNMSAAAAQKNRYNGKVARWDMNGKSFLALICCVPNAFGYKHKLECFERMLVSGVDTLKIVKEENAKKEKEFA